MSAIPTDKQKTDQIIEQCLVKAAHVVLGSRYDSSTPPRQQPGRKTWFCLDIDEVDIAAQVFDHWRTDTSTPAYIEVYLRPWGGSEEQVEAAPSNQSQTCQNICVQSNAFPSATLLERWLFHYEPVAPEVNLQRRRTQLARLDPPALYKRAVVMLRSLTSYVRMLPGYRLYRACKRSSSSAACLGFCLLKGHQSNADQSKTSRLRHFSFTPLDTIHGQFKIEVDYAPASTVSFLEQSTIASQQPEIISDYVRGAQPAELMHRGPAALQGGLTASFQGTRPPMLSPASEGLQRTSSGLRRHSWSREVVRISPPSPTLTGQTPFGSVGRPPLAAPATLMPSPSLPTHATEQVHQLPQPRLQRTASSPWQAQPSSPGDLPGLLEGICNQSDASCHEALPLSTSPGSGLHELQARPNSTGTEPVRIPSCKPKVFSSNDLVTMGTSAWPGADASQRPSQTAMVRQYGFGPCPASAPSSAPAATGFVAPPPVQSQKGLLRGVTAAKPPLNSNSPTAGAMLPPTPPNAPSHPVPGSSETGSSSSSATYAGLLSGSPQLPFAFTPSPHSLPTLADRQGQSSPSSMRSSYLSPSPPISGRDISALAVIRRPSWSGAARTGSYEGSSATTGTLQHAPTGSPLQDSFSLEASLLGSSGARQVMRDGRSTAFGTTLPSMSSSKPLVLPSTGLPGSSSTSFGAPRLTYPSPPDPDMASLQREESESDILPFAIDGDAGSPFDVAPLSEDTDAGSELSTADAVTRWVQDHPLLHTVEEGPNTPPALSPHLVNTDAEAQLALLRPMIQSAVVP